MKANEAPENIYLLPDDRNSTNLSICWYEAPYSTGAIEYTRTDAFIEKVINFLNYKLYDVVATQVSGTIIPHHVAKQELIEDFRKYMEGE